MPDPSKFVMGTQLYAMDWPAGGGPANPAAAYEHADALALVQQLGVTPRLDAPTDALTFRYTDAGGTLHDVWYADATTVERRFALATARGLGIGVWRLGQEDQRLWESPLLARVPTP